MISKKKVVVVSLVLLWIVVSIAVISAVILIKNIKSKNEGIGTPSKVATMSSNAVHATPKTTNDTKTEVVDPAEIPSTTEPTPPTSNPTTPTELGEIEFTFEVKSSTFNQVSMTINFYIDKEAHVDEPVPITDIFKFWFIHPSGKEIHLPIVVLDESTHDASEFYKIFSEGKSVGYRDGDLALFKFHPNDADLQPYPGIWKLKVLAPVGIDAIFGNIEI